MYMLTNDTPSVFFHLILIILIEVHVAICIYLSVYIQTLTYVYKIFKDS